LLLDQYGGENINLKNTCDSLLQLVDTGKMQKDGWKFTSDFHLTCLYLDRDEDKAENSQIYQRFKEGTKINVDI